GHRLPGHGLLVDELLGFLSGQRLEGLGDLHLAAPRLFAELAEHVLEPTEAHLLDALPAEDLQEGRAVLGDLDLDLPVVELTSAQEATELLPGAIAIVGGRGRDGGHAWLR